MKKAFFRNLTAAMIVLVGIAAAVFLSGIIPKPTAPPAAPTDGGLPDNYQDAIDKAREAEGQACEYASRARGAAENARAEAGLADTAADIAQRGDQGYAVRHFADGTYAGQVSNGAPDGHGVKTFTGGSTYRGEWSDGKPDHLGVLKLQGVTYEGRFSAGQKSEIGVETQDGGQTYEGQWESGQPKGYAILHGAPSDDFEEKFGQFNGQGNSFGVFRRKDATQILGAFTEDKRDGICVELNAQDVPINAGYCAEDQLKQQMWSKKPGDPAIPFPRDQRCLDVGSGH